MAGKLKKGLFITGIGCLSAIILVVGVVGVGLLWATLSARKIGAPDPVSASRTVSLGTPTPRNARSRPMDGSALAPDSLELALPVAARPLHLNIDLQEGLFHVNPGPPGTAVTIQGTFARNYYALSEEQEDEADGSQTLTIRLTPTAGLFTRMLAGLTHISQEHPNKLEITIPRQVPIDLHLLLSSGESHTDLGGLTLTGLQMTLTKGSHRLDFKEPLTAGLQKVVLHTTMGDSRVYHLGNTRAKEVYVTSRMGDFRYDLEGDWLAGSHSEVRISHSMGNLRLLVPRDVRLTTASSGHVRFGDLSGIHQDDETGDPEAPEVTLHLSATMGEARVSRH